MTILTNFLPSLGALAVASFFVLITNHLKTKKRLGFQVTIVVGAMGVSFAYVRAHFDALRSLWMQFLLLGDPKLQFALTTAIICIVYIGGGFYAIQPKEPSTKNSKNNMPATSDHVTTFDVPAKLPENDTVFFEEMFNRFSAEITRDMPTVYEMPEEAVAWVERMIPYTVAGGKMNRGLAVLSVQRTLYENYGVPLTNKV